MVTLNKPSAGDTDWTTEINDNWTALENAVTVLDRSTTDVDVVNTLSETAIHSVTIPANKLGTDKGVRLTILGDILNNSGANRNFTIKVKYGTTTLYEDTTATPLGADSARRAFFMSLTLSAKGATNSQLLCGLATISNRGAATTGTGKVDIMTNLNGFCLTLEGTAAEDSTSAQTLQVTITWPTAHSSLSWRKRYAVLESL